MDNISKIISDFLPCVEAWLREAMSQEIAKALEADRAKQKPEKMYTRDEVCAMLGISKPTLWARTKSGDLKCTKVGRRVLYTESELKKVVGQ
jgi:excisionase family DNA binding protein